MRNNMRKENIRHMKQSSEGQLDGDIVDALHFG